MRYNEVRYNKGRDPADRNMLGTLDITIGCSGCKPVLSFDIAQLEICAWHKIVSNTKCQFCNAAKHK